MTVEFRLIGDDATEVAQVLAVLGDALQLGAEIRTSPTRDGFGTRAYFKARVRQEDGDGGPVRAEAEVVRGTALVADGGRRAVVRGRRR